MTRKRRHRVRRKAGQVDALVLDCIKRSAEPVTAYEITRQIKTAGECVAPMQVYRSLSRLRGSHNVEAVASLNAFVPAAGECSLHLLCSKCGAHQATQAQAADKLLREICLDLKFELRTRHLEMVSHCRECKAGLIT